MTLQLLILFIVGLICCLIAYLHRQKRLLKNLFATLGVLFILFPLAIIVYFLAIIFTA